MSTDDTPLRGYLDEAGANRIAGWAENRDGPVRIRILDNGGLLGTVTAGLHRPDLVLAGIGNGDYGFSLDLDAPLSPTLPHRIQAVREDDGTDIGNSPWVIPGSGPTCPGHLDHAGPTSIVGWAQDEGAGWVILEILDNGARIARVVADALREDLVEAGVGDGRHGFALALPTPLSPATRHVIEVRRERDGANLPGSPAVIDAEPGAASSAPPEPPALHVLVVGDDPAAPALHLPDHHVSHLPLAPGGSLPPLPHSPLPDAVILRGPAGLLPALRAAAPGARILFGVPGDVSLADAPLADAPLADVPLADALVVHAADRQHALAAAHPGTPVHLIGWDAALQDHPRPFEQRHGIVLHADFADPAALQATAWLIEQVMPAVLAAAPRAHCLLFGPGLEPHLALARRGVLRIGPVPDMGLAGYDRARLSVALHGGAAAQAVESFAHGLPCALTPAAVRGLPHDPALAGLVAEGAQALATLILRLHEDEAANRTATEAGRAMLARSFAPAPVAAAWQAALSGEAPVHAPSAIPAPAPAAPARSRRRSRT